MRIIAFSDTHGHKVEVPNGDVLVFAGDYAATGAHHDLIQFAQHYGAMPHPLKIFVAGNHDWACQRDSSWAKGVLKDFVVLEDSGLEWGGVSFYGTPWQPVFFDWAFNADSERLVQYYEQIPTGVDVLITHCPRAGVLDLCKDGHVGSRELAFEFNRIKPKIHIFGHIHESHGFHDNGVTKSYNVSVCDKKYKPINPVTIIDL